MLRRAAVAISAALLIIGMAASAATSERYMTGFPPRARDRAPTPARDPGFTIAGVTALKTAEFYHVTVSLQRRRSGSVLVSTDWLPPPGDPAAIKTTSIETEGDQVTFDRFDVSGAWGLTVHASDRDTIVDTPIVPLGALTGEGIPEEVRAWHDGARYVGDVVDPRDRCRPPARAVLDGFRAAVVRDNAHFTLHFRAAPGAVDAFEGSTVTAQIARVEIQSDPTNPTSVVGVELDVARKTATYLDARTSPPRRLGAIKIDVLGQNVLLKTSWRFGDPSTPLKDDGTLGTISPSAVVRAFSEVRTADGRCVVETPWAPIDQLAPRVRETPTPLPAPTGGGVTPSVGLILAFGGIGAIVGLAALSRRRAQRAGSTAGGGSSADGAPGD